MSWIRVVRLTRIGQKLRSTITSPSPVEGPASGSWVGACVSRLGTGGGGVLILDTSCLVHRPPRDRNRYQNTDRTGQTSVAVGEDQAQT